MRNETRTQDVLIKEQDCATLNSNFHCVRGDAEENNWFPFGVRMGYIQMRVGCICSLYITTFCTLVLLGYLLGLTLRLLMSYIYMEHLFLMFLDHTQRRSTVGRAPLDE